MLIPFNMQLLALAGAENKVFFFPPAQPWGETTFASADAFRAGHSLRDTLRDSCVRCNAELFHLWDDSSTDLKYQIVGRPMLKTRCDPFCGILIECYSYVPFNIL